MVSVTRAYVATASTSKDRMKAISVNTAFFAAGIAIGPGLLVAFTPLQYPGVELLGGALRINMYTAPAFVGVGCLLIITLLMLTAFKEKYSGIVPEKTKEGTVE